MTKLTDFGFHKYAKDSSYFQDFLAGAEPTGKSTFENAAKNKEHHTRHRLVGDLGGLVGGALLGVGTGVAGSYGIGKTLQLIKPSSKTGESLVDAAKYQLQVFNVPESIRILKRYQQAHELTNSMSDNLGNVLKQTRAVGQPLNSTKNRALPFPTAEMGATVKKTIKDGIDMANYQRMHGELPQDTVGKGYGIIGAGIAAGMGAATNTLSADVQYRSGQNQGKLIQELRKRSKA